MRIMRLSIITLFMSITMCISCNKVEDNGERGFMNKATIIGDSDNGYYCYLDGGGLVISYDRNLAEAERGYFNFRYMETDWKTSSDGIKYIDNAHVNAWDIYAVIHPISLEDAKSKHITDPDSCQIPSLLSLGYGYRGFFDLNGGFNTFNRETGESISAKINLVYDPAEQYPDTLQLQLCCNKRIPNTWTKTNVDYSTVSCDISSLLALQQLEDSVYIVVKVDKNKYLTRISKSDFQKPSISIKNY